MVDKLNEELWVSNRPYFLDLINLFIRIIKNNVMLATTIQIEKSIINPITLTVWNGLLVVYQENGNPYSTSSQRRQGVFP